MSLTPGQIVALLVEKPAAGGAMIARVDGQIVLVSGAIPGERVQARIVRTGKGVAYAEVVGVDEASPDRQPPFVDPACGGCLYAFIRYERQLAIKSAVIADAFARIAHLPLSAAPSVRPSPEAGYRMRARLHVRGARVGFFREGTHDLCEVAPTRQLLAATVETVERIAAAIGSVRLDAVREIELSENLDASERAIALVATGPLPPRVADAIASTAGLTGTLLESEQFSKTVAGSPYVTDALTVGGAPVKLRRHVLAFFQGNRYLLQALVDRVLDAIDPGSDVIDLYAGAGLFAVSAAIARRARVVAVEGDRLGAADLTANAAAAGADVSAVHQAVESFAAPAAADAIAIVDPPRTGLSRAALAAVLAIPARRLVYVSCDVATLARDARKIVDAGYTLKELEAFDLFPNTPHVETVVVFDRR